MINPNRVAVRDGDSLPARGGEVEDLLKLWFSLPPRGRELAFMDTAQAAEMAHVARRTVEGWIDAGDIGALCIGRKLYVLGESVRNRIRLESGAWAAGKARSAGTFRKRPARPTHM